MRAVEYRQLAFQCRAIAASLKGDARAELLEVAAAWDQLAEDSEKRSGAYFGLRPKPSPASLLRAE